jgi:hypothetical protein
LPPRFSLENRRETPEGDSNSEVGTDSNRDRKAVTILRMTQRHWSGDDGVRILAISFLLVSFPVETLYSWRGWLPGPYYWVKVCGWALLISGVMQLHRRRPASGRALLIAGWSWLAANFWRAIVDRLARVWTGQTLRLGSIELWFAGSCLLASLFGLSWLLVHTIRNDTD